MLLVISEAVADNKIRFKLVAASPMVVIKGSDVVLQNIVAMLYCNIFSFLSEQDIHTIIWKKVISNCVFNSICPLLETDNSIFQRNEEVLQIAKAVVGECLTVAKEHGIELNGAHYIFI